jgi:two-component system chemotaxis response regulator CheY
MFNLSELNLLIKEIKSNVEQGKSRLDSKNMSDEQRHRLENRVFTLISIYSKLERLQEQTSREEHKQVTPRVLIVEDVKSMRLLNRQLFVSTGFERVDTAEDGGRALQMMQQAVENESRYGLVISDWEMPKMTGLDLLRAIRLDETLWRTPFYLLTAVHDIKHIREAINTGANGYMVKPVNQQLIMDKFGPMVKK